MSSGDAETGLRLRIERTGLRGASEATLVRETGLDAATVGADLERLAAAGRIERLADGICLARDSADRLMSELTAALDAYHLREPLKPGMPRAELAGTLPENVVRGVGAALLDRLAERGEIAIRGEHAIRTGFTSTLDDASQAIADDLRARLAAAELDPPFLRALAEESKLADARLREVAHYLEREGVLVAAPDDLFFDRACVASLVERVIAHFDDHDELDTQTLKALIGTSRRTAMPLMALLDALQITRRDGSIRRLSGREPRWSL